MENQNIEIIENQNIENQNIEIVNNDDVKKEKKCECCNVMFKNNRDMENHFKTAKHIKNALKIDESKCPFCSYKSDEKSNMNRHVKTIHNYENEKISNDVSKKLIKTKLPKAVIKDYFLKKEAVNKMRFIRDGKISRIKRLKNRLFKPDDPIYIEAITDYNETKKQFDNLLTIVENYEKDYPELKNEPPPVKVIISEQELEKREKEEEENEKKEIEEEKIRQEKRQNLIDQYNKIIDEASVNYASSRGDKQYMEKIKEYERKLREL